MNEEQKPVSTEEEREALEFFEGRKNNGWNWSDHGNVLARSLRQAREKLAEAERMIKNLAPTGRYNGLDIEQWKDRAIAAESRAQALARERDDLIEEQSEHAETIAAKDALLEQAREVLESAHRGCGDLDTEPLDENGGDQRERGEVIRRFLAQFPVTPARASKRKTGGE